MTISTNRESDRFMLRLPDGMRDRIKATAEANSRSMNAEIVATLEERYRPRSSAITPGPHGERVVKHLEAQTRHLANLAAVAALKGEMRAIEEIWGRPSSDDEHQRFHVRLLDARNRLAFAQSQLCETEEALRNSVLALFSPPC